MKFSFFTITENNHSDLHLGFEVQSPEKEFISWDITYNELMKNPLVDIETNQTNFYKTVWYDIRFKYPVRVGNVIFSDFKTSLSEIYRSDIPVLEYEISKENCPQEEYQFLKKQFPKEEAEMVFSFYYSPEQGNWLYFTIINHREYFDLLQDVDYEDSMEISQYLTLGKEVQFGLNYRLYSQVKRTPPLLERFVRKKPAIWRDDKNGYLGISAEGFSVKYPLSQIEKIEIERVFPAKGGGGDYFRLILKNVEYNKSSISAPCYFFDAYLDKISSLLGKKVEVVGFYYDC